ncbi:MAG: nuclear transport factor 2 family protein [Candidatus Sumerlaeaceae bacterium]|nr:nuclear transport factor 2 family protein [Candidatus Sumerlaeaceae bacterium]
MNLRRRQVIYGGALVTLGVVLMVVALQTSERARIEKTVRAMARLCEMRDAEGLAAYLAPDYSGIVGTTREEAIEKARRAFEDVDALRIKILHVETEVDGDRAEAMVVFQSEGSVILADTKSRLPFKNMTAVSGQNAELVFTKFSKAGDKWLLAYATFDVRSKLPRFPRTAAFLARQ